MSAKASVVKLLLDSPEIAALVARRIHISMAKQTDQMPYITVERTQGEHNYDLSTDSGLVNEDFTLDLYAETVAGAEALSKAVENEIKKWASYQAFAGGENTRTWLHAGRIVNISEEVLQRLTGGDAYIYHVSIDITTWSKDV